MRGAVWFSLLVLLACDSDPLSELSEVDRPDASSEEKPNPQPSVDAGANNPTDAATPPMTSCAGWAFTPNPSATGSVNQIAYTSAVRGYVYVDLIFEGLGQVKKGQLEVTRVDPAWTWQWPVTLSRPGEWKVSFVAEQPPQTISSCRFVVADTGLPPPLVDPEPDPNPNCDGKVCGESDEAGGQCQVCPMAYAAGGACMDPPSPITPSGSGQWACLDNANCSKSGSCKIWCPGEPCDTTRHPEGCPNGVEACWVPPHITDYEEACRQCCNSRYHSPTGEYACWDDNYNICRYPGECGRPYPQ